MVYSNLCSIQCAWFCHVPLNHEWRVCALKTIFGGSRANYDYVNECAAQDEVPPSFLVHRPNCSNCFEVGMHGRGEFWDGVRLLGRFEGFRELCFEMEKALGRGAGVPKADVTSMSRDRPACPRT